MNKLLVSEKALGVLWRECGCETLRLLRYCASCLLLLEVGRVYPMMR